MATRWFLPVKWNPELQRENTRQNQSKDPDRSSDDDEDSNRAQACEGKSTTGLSKDCGDIQAEKNWSQIYQRVRKNCQERAETSQHFPVDGVVIPERTLTAETLLPSSNRVSVVSMGTGNFKQAVAMLPIPEFSYTPRRKTEEPLRRAEGGGNRAKERAEVDFLKQLLPCEASMSPEINAR
ncbi:hypothetical protein U0070_015806 [Myodes glareolus]|uniref:Prolactin receptor n=1 Tax=Myodes glareolus TaxID=447135 RepID=A0AAW0HG04_MYOGA